MALAPFTQENFEELWRRLLPEAYTHPIETEGDGVGFDGVAAHAAMWASVEIALNLSQQGYYLRDHSTRTGPIASGPRKASGQVLVARAAPAQGDIILPQGTLFRALATDSLGDSLFLGRYRSTADVTVTGGSGGPFTVPVEAEFPGYTGNLEPGYVTEFQELGRASVPSIATSTTRFQRVAGLSGLTDRFEPGFIGRYVRLAGALLSENGTFPRQVVSTFVDANGEIGIEVDLALSNPADAGASVTVEVEEYADLGLTVNQPAAITDGVPDALGALGTDRARARAAGEGDENFRVRLGQLADIISPASHIRILNRILGSAGIPYEYLEVGDPQSLMGFTWGVHPWGYGQLPFQTRPPGAQIAGQGIVWLPRSSRYFVVLVQASGLGEYRMPWGAAVFPAGHPNAWGHGIWGGSQIGAAGFNALVGQLWQELNEARAGGVAFQIFLR